MAIIASISVISMAIMAIIINNGNMASAQWNKYHRENEISMWKRNQNEISMKIMAMKAKIMANEKYQ
jgi:hypothetical protein